MKNIIQYFLKTNDSSYYLVPRIMLGVVIFPHGAQKLFGLFGGFGFTNSMSYFTSSVGLPWIVAFLLIIAESLGSIGLIFGFLTRLCAFGLICVMTGAIFMVHLQHGWSDMEWQALILAICLLYATKGNAINKGNQI